MALLSEDGLKLLSNLEKRNYRRSLKLKNKKEETCKNKEKTKKLCMLKKEMHWCNKLKSKMHSRLNLKQTLIKLLQPLPEEFKKTIMLIKDVTSC
jgi:hypothetical protein